MSVSNCVARGHGFAMKSFALIGLTALLISSSANAVDVFGTERYVPLDSTAEIVGPTICSFGALGNPLLLPETIERSLCENPKTRQAWTGVKQAAAALGEAKSAYLPTFSATWQGVRDDSVDNVLNHPTLSSQDREFVRSDSATFSWVLYDFGGRKNALINASELLTAAQANQLAVLQTVFTSTAKDYYAAQAAKGALKAAAEIEESSKQSFTAASARVAGGAAPVSDQLQAQTAFAQAVVNRVKAEADWKTAEGLVAADMSINPSIPLQLPEVEDGVRADADFDSSVESLIDTAKTLHPSIIAAQAQVDAAVAKAHQIRDQGYPTISYVAKYSHNNQPASLGLGVPEFPAVGHDTYMGVQVSIPIFEGFSRNYQVREAEAQVEAQLEGLSDARNKVGLEVWSAYQALRESTDNLPNSASLLDVASLSFTAAQRRYQVGVGSILDLLTAQEALAAAKRQRIQSLTDWRNDRLRLAGSLGRLGAHSFGPQ